MIQQENKLDLLALLDTMKDGKVTLLGESLDIKDALAKVGLTEQEHKQLLSFRDNHDYYTDIVKLIKIENDMHINPDECVNEAVMSQFNSSLKSMTDYMHARSQKIKQETTIGPSYFDHNLEFEDKNNVDAE